MDSCHEKLVKSKADRGVWFGYFGPIKIRIRDDDSNSCTLEWGFGQCTSDAVQIEDSWVEEIAVLADILKKHKMIIDIKKELFVKEEVD